MTADGPWETCFSRPHTKFRRHTPKRELNDALELEAKIRELTRPPHKPTKPLTRYTVHLPIGQSSCIILIFTRVKQPQILQRMPVWCSQAAHVGLRFC